MDLQKSERAAGAESIAARIARNIILSDALTGVEKLVGLTLALALASEREGALALADTFTMTQLAQRCAIPRTEAVITYGYLRKMGLLVTHTNAIGKPLFVELTDAQLADLARLDATEDQPE